MPWAFIRAVSAFLSSQQTSPYFILHNHILVPRIYALSFPPNKSLVSEILIISPLPLPSIPYPHIFPQHQTTRIPIPKTRSFRSRPHSHLSHRAPKTTTDHFTPLHSKTASRTLPTAPIAFSLPASLVSADDVLPEDPDPLPLFP